MGDIETVKVVNPNDPDGGHMIINRSDFDESKHTLHPDNEGEVGSDAKSDARRHFEHNDELRKLEANRGVAGGPAVNSDGRNPSGTFSEPTPTDIRYPNKDETEFENNHGAFVQKSAAQMREEKGLPPGGFGLLLARGTVDELLYNEIGNEVLLIKYIDRASPMQNDPLVH